jgi:chorismate synthase
MKDMGGDGQSEKESECKEPPRPDRAQLTRKEKWEIRAAKRGARKQRPRIKYPLGAP